MKFARMVKGGERAVILLKNLGCSILGLAKRTQQVV